MSCRGGTALAALASEVTFVLDELGVAEAADEVEDVVAAAEGGRGVVVVDGCASACRAHLLEARGVAPVAALNLSELGVTGEQAAGADPRRVARLAARRLASRPAAGRTGRPRFPALAPHAPEPGRPHDVRDYLRAIDGLASTAVECGALADGAPTLAVHVSRALGVSRASAGEMVARLEEGGLVARGGRKEVLLTARGRAEADRAVRRHRLLECFVTGFLGFPLAESDAQAALLDAAFDEAAIESLSRALGRPERCPHGWPLDPRRAREESLELAALTSLQEGERGAVARIVESDFGLIEALGRLGLLPGARVAVTAGADRRLLAVEVEGATRHVDASAASAVFVRTGQRLRRAPVERVL